jgi:hypothetical protein
MATKARDYKKDWAAEKKRAAVELPRRAARAKIRREYDAKGIDRSNRDIAHVKALSHGGANKMSNTTLQAPSKNRSFSRTSSGKMKRKGA